VWSIKPGTAVTTTRRSVVASVGVTGIREVGIVNAREIRRRRGCEGVCVGGTHTEFLGNY